MEETDRFIFAHEIVRPKVEIHARRGLRLGDRGIFIILTKRSIQEAHIHIRGVTGMALVLFALNAFSLNLGYGAPNFFRLCGLLALVGTALLYISPYTKIVNKNIFTSGAIILAISIIALFLSTRPEIWLTSLVAFLCGFDLIRRSSGDYKDSKPQDQTHQNLPKDDLRHQNLLDQDILPALALGSLIYTTFYIFYTHSPALFMGLRYISLGITGTLGRLSGVPSSIGPTMSCLLIFLAFISCASAIFLLSKKDSPSSQKAFLGGLAGLILAYVVYILVLAAPWMTPKISMDDLYLAVLLYLVPLALFAPKIEVKPVQMGTLLPTPKEGAVLAGIFLAVLLITIFPYYGQVSPGKAVLYERDSEMGFNVPQFPTGNQSFEPDNDFSVGATSLCLENIGFKVEELNDTNPHTLKEALKGANLLMMLNLKKPFNASELDVIHKFVENGGNLLIFGEHTAMFTSDENFSKVGNYLNDVLAPTGIKINADTADYIQGHWTYGSVPLPHYVTKDLGYEITTSSVGASLDISGCARPLILGRFAFCDNPNSTNQGHLGDRTYENGETLGDVIVAASSSYGQGKVLVFGDTSYIFNVEMPFRYGMIYDAVAWLSSKDQSFGPALAWLSLAILVTLAGFIALVRPRQDLRVSFMASAAVILALSLAVSGSINESWIQSPQGGEVDMAWIDAAHLNQFNMDSFKDDGIAGLTTNLFRNGYLPLVLRSHEDFSEVSKGKVVFILAPNIPYTSDEISSLRKFVEDGGLLVISAGQKSRVPIAALLDSLSIQIGNLPLGSPPWIVETHGNLQGTVNPENLKKYWHEPKFMEAYPISASGNYTPITWLSYGGNGYNLIISKSLRHGEVVLIGDSRFLLNENLEYLSEGQAMETKEQYQLQWLGNIELLREILTKHKEGKV